MKVSPKEQARRRGPGTRGSKEGEGTERRGGCSGRGLPAGSALVRDNIKKNDGGAEQNREGEGKAVWKGIRMQGTSLQRSRGVTNSVWDRSKNKNSGSRRQNAEWKRFGRRKRGGGTQ